MARACFAAGFHACGIGHRAKSLPQCPCLDMDLLLEWTQSFVLDLIACPRVLVWLFIVCGVTVDPKRATLVYSHTALIVTSGL